MNSITFFNILKKNKKSTYVECLIKTKVNEVVSDRIVLFGSRNIYIKLSDATGVRICSGHKKTIKKICKIQSILNEHGLAPRLFFCDIFEILILNSEIKRIVKNFRKKITKVYCLFQEHIHPVRLYDYKNEKYSTVFVNFRKKVREISTSYGFKDWDLKKGNILISENGPRCIDFDEWKITNKCLFNKISFKPEKISI
jgi:hypothetical protein